MVAKDGGATIAYRAEPPPTPSPPATPSPAPTASPAPGAGSASPAPSPSASPAPKADKTKEPGALLTIRDLVAGTRVTAADATDFVVSDDDRFVAYATETKNGKGDGLHVYDVVRGTTRDVLTGAGRYRDLAIARDGSSMAFLSDVATYQDDVPHDALYVVDLRAATPAAAKTVDAGSAGLAAKTTPNANGTRRLFARREAGVPGDRGRPDADAVGDARADGGRPVDLARLRAAVTAEA